MLIVIIAWGPPGASQVNNLLLWIIPVVSDHLQDCSFRCPAAAACTASGRSSQTPEQVPLAPVPPGAWASLAIDMRSLVARCFAGSAQPPRAPPGAQPPAYAALDGIALAGTGRLRRVFTLRDAPMHEVCVHA